MQYTDTCPRRAPTEVFWREIAPVEHSVQIYANQSLLIDALEGFASSGLRAGEAVIIIATEKHRHALAQRLHTRGFDLDLARAQDLYVPVDAAGALSQFMVGGSPNETRFIELVAGLLTRARGNGRRVRAFGELVVILWDQGNAGATLGLESMWNKLCEAEAFWLFCAYPRGSFSRAANGSIADICAHHSRVFPE